MKLTDFQVDVAWEDELAPDDHFDIASLLSHAFPAAAARFGSTRSWAGARPEIRVLVRDQGLVVAHAAVLRRFVGIGTVEQLVGDVGLVAVQTHLRDQGLGRTVMERIGEVVRDIGAPFALANVGRARLNSSIITGWQHLRGVKTSYLTNGQPLYASRRDYPVVILPTSDPAVQWPAGDLLRIHGFEL